MIIRVITGRIVAGRKWHGGRGERVKLREVARLTR